MVTLHSERARRAQRNEREAAGENLWSDEIPRAAKVKIASLWDTIKRTSGVHAATFDAGIGRIVKRELGLNVDSVSSDGFIQSSNDYALDLIGILYMWLDNSSAKPLRVKHFETMVNAIFEDYRVAFRMVDGDVLPFESDEIHKGVVEPALRLLVGAQFEGANKAYVKAIKEVPVDPSDAITDAGTALQETLKALECDGNALGPLIKSAKAKGLLAPHDSNLEAGIKSFLEWASADRSETGDGHKVTDATRADAWLMIHVVGALIVRLADGAPRASTE